MDAGFRVVGIDIEPQKHYCGDGFIQMDFFDFFEAVMWGDYPQPDAWHASPPCQGYSIMNNLPWLRGRDYPLLILPTLEALESTGKPYILENVMGARHGAKGLTKRGIESHGLKAGYLCGTMFGLPFYRHRLFATNFLWLAPGHPKHRGIIKRGPYFGNNGGRLAQVVFSAAEDSRGIESWPNRRGTEAGSGLTLWQNRHPEGGVGIGLAKGWWLAAAAMGINWMTRAELCQAIPPAYSEYLGKYLMMAIKADA